MLQAPEYGDKYVFFTRVGVGEVDVYRYLRNDQTGQPEWQIINRIYAPAGFPLFLFGRTLRLQGARPG